MQPSGRTRCSAAGAPAGFRVQRHSTYGRSAGGAAVSRYTLLRRDLEPEEPQSAAHRTARRLDGSLEDLGAGHEALETLLEPLAEVRAAREQPAGERHRD